MRRAPPVFVAGGFLQQREFSFCCCPPPPPQLFPMRVSRAKLRWRDWQSSPVCASCPYWSGMVWRSIKDEGNIMLYYLQYYVVLIRIHYCTFYWFCAVLVIGYELKMKYLLSMLRKLSISLIKARWLFLRLKVQSLFMLKGPRCRRSKKQTQKIMQSLTLSRTVRLQMTVAYFWATGLHTCG